MDPTKRGGIGRLLGISDQHRPVDPAIAAVAGKWSASLAVTFPYRSHSPNLSSLRAVASRWTISVRRGSHVRDRDDPPVKTVSDRTTSAGAAPSPFPLPRRGR